MGIQYGINYSQGSILSISTVEEKIHSFILLLEILCGERIEAYQQLMMDEEVQIFTVNNFLKAMQMVEGIERVGDRKKAHKEFKKIRIIH